ncbi:DEAD/DEAH box helicase, partial [Streptomyces sp. NPDC055078]
MSTQPVWAEEEIAGNKVRQLLVPGSALGVNDEDGTLRVSNVYGSWPAVGTAGGRRQRADGCAAQPVRPRGAPAGKPRLYAAGGSGVVSQSDRFRPYDEPHSLRRPQIGALHAVTGHWA